MITMVKMDGCLMRLAASFNTYAVSHMLVAVRFVRWKESERGMLLAACARDMLWFTLANAH